MALLPVLASPSAQPPRSALPVHDTEASRSIEARALQAQTAAGALMARAGLAVARLALALAPHQGTFWVLCGPGNNGGDGLVAARHLHQQGSAVRVILAGVAERLPTDARQALEAARAAGVSFAEEPPPSSEAPRLVIDALLGQGQTRPLKGRLAELAHWCNTQPAPVLSVDLPSGMQGDTGQATGEAVVQATATLSLLTLKPGLFTGRGRDLAGALWWDDLGIHPDDRHRAATAWITGEEDARPLWPLRRHGQHKGSFGDLWVLAGARGMTGAALLAGRAGLAGGAGRVYVSLLDDAPPLDCDLVHPELMFRRASGWQAPDVLEAATLVCGCGGGDAVRQVLPEALARARRLVLDADGLNAVAAEPGLQEALRARADRGLATVLTPHPLEAARLAGCSSADIQADRIAHALALARQLRAVVLLKGSGTVVATPSGACWLNPTGHGGLACPGSGDILAGWLGAAWSAQLAADDEVGLAARVAAASAWLHGRAATQALPEPHGPILAETLIAAMARELSLKA
ncbi:bifunctional ADP-dependent NAD(P)H-hydrate dehydratase/NAD(P)H-hydrate epimerase [Ideonella sp. B508-1]|uniref:bifunctional ADP-dependent NAD(P)H-hydrate dehydratase/NAD(P)H-hydrate epimerase n=1 Tax=Ideonella sp. B508-1 TaxID=137716 RepID=UPI0003B76E55|nr:bifunctional ADP-dependent NAD(P)H-hydrate dehydratase/NAD(P)H-hydrate epimerase [Ideonella sp. B508-1]